MAAASSRRRYLDGAIDKHAADRLDPVRLPAFVDESGQRLPWRSSSTPEETPAALADLVGAPQLAVLALKGLHALALRRGEAAAQALIGLSAAHPLTQRLGRHAELGPRSR